MKEDTKILARVNGELKKLKNNDFTLYFFVVDCKNVPNGSMQYIYHLAKTLSDMKYNVKMIYQLENEYTKKELDELNRKEKVIDERRLFVGVGEWLGKEYMELEHINISKTEWTVSPSDFLFIPEVFSSLMKQTYQYKAPCKRIIILTNYNYVTEFIPFNDEWGTYGIRDVITTTEMQGGLAKSVFPYISTKVLNPYIEECFRKPVKPKKLIVNIVSKRTQDVNKIIKEFYWKYPKYKFIAFRDLRGYPQNVFSDYLKESAITVWIDSETPFGYSALEAIRCNNIVVGKVPENMPEWMDGCGVWTYDINAIPDLLVQVISSWMKGQVPQTIYDAMDNVNKRYSKTEWNANVKRLIEDYVNSRIEEFVEVKSTINNKNA